MEVKKTGSNGETLLSRIQIGSQQIFDKWGGEERDLRDICGCTMEVEGNEGGNALAMEGMCTIPLWAHKPVPDVSDFAHSHGTRALETPPLVTPCKRCGVHFNSLCP